MTLFERIVFQKISVASYCFWGRNNYWWTFEIIYLRSIHTYIPIEVSRNTKGWLLLFEDCVSWQALRLWISTRILAITQLSLSNKMYVRGGYHVLSLSGNYHCVTTFPRSSPLATTCAQTPHSYQVQGVREDYQCA